MHGWSRHASAAGQHGLKPHCTSLSGYSRMFTEQGARLEGSHRGRGRCAWSRRVTVQAGDKPVRRKASRPSSPSDTSGTFRQRPPTDLGPSPISEVAVGARRRAPSGAELLVGSGAVLPSAAASGARGFARTETPRGLSGKQIALQRQTELDPLTTPIDERHLLDGAVFHDLVSSCNLLPSWRPQVTLFCRLGMSKRDLRILSSDDNARIFTAGTAATLQRKLTFLRVEAGMSDAQLKRLLLTYPRIVEYGLAGVLVPHLDFLKSLGIPQDKLAQVVLKAPSAMTGLSVEGSLEPRVAILSKAVGLPRGELGRLVQRCPAVLTLSDDTILDRIDFLHGCGMDGADVARAIIRHPEVLYYRRISMAGRVEWLMDAVGLNPAQLARVLAAQPAILSLSIARNLQPKWQYLQQQLGGTSDTVARYPVYLTLSLLQRIIPRHRYLTSIRGAPVRNPFPVAPYLTWSDAMFASTGARTSLEDYRTFRAKLLASLGPGLEARPGPARP